VRTTRRTGSLSGLPARVTLLLIACLTLYGCGSGNLSGQLSQVSSPVTSTQTPATTPATTRTLSPPEFDATKIASIDAPHHEWETRVASGTPFVVTPIPMPSEPVLATPELGITGNCAYGNHQFAFGGCWAGIVDGEYLFVETGAFKDDATQGAIRMYTSTMDLLIPGPDQVYYTPSRMGRVHPVQVVWPIMSLITLDHDPPVTFAFNLSTRQWVTPSPGPSPSPMQSPLSSPLPSP